jgi:hypothetical protein
MPLDMTRARHDAKRWQSTSIGGNRDVYMSSRSGESSYHYFGTAVARNDVPGLVYYCLRER